MNASIAEKSIDPSDSILSDDDRRYYVKLSLGEKAAYGFWGFGSDLVFQTVTIFLTFFYTDIFGITPAQVTVLFLVARIWDSVIDPLVGAIVEKCHFKMGKYKSWMVYLSIPYAITTILCFTTPDSAAIKVAFAWVTYIIFGTVFSFMIIPSTSLSSSMTQDPVERTVLNSFRMFCSQLGGVGAAIFVPYLAAHLGSTPAQGYQYAMIILAVVMAASFITTGLFCKERVPETVTAEPFKFREIFSQFYYNKPLIRVFFLFFCVYTFNIMVSSVGTYYITYNAQRPDMMSFFSMLQVLPSVIPLLFVPAMVRKMGKKAVVMLGCVISLVGCVVFFLSPDNALTAACIGKSILSFGYGIELGIMWSLLPDTVEYGEYVTGKRAGAVVFSLGSFAIKIGLTVAGVIPTIVLDAVGYVPNAVQSAQTLMAIKLLNSLIPAAFLVIAVLVFAGYTLTDKRFEEIVKVLADRRRQSETNVSNR